MAVIVPWLPVSGLDHGTGLLPHCVKLSAETMFRMVVWSDEPLLSTGCAGATDPVTVAWSGTALSMLKPFMAQPDNKHSATPATKPEQGLHQRRFVAPNFLLSDRKNAKHIPLFNKVNPK